MTEEELMLSSLLDCRRIDLYVDPKPLSLRQEKKLIQMQLRRRQGEPLQYIVGSVEFMGLNFVVDSRVLIPRPETEILLERVLTLAQQLRSPHLRILDLGTGSGNIAISLAKFIDSSSVTAIDISPEAIELAKMNVKNHSVASKINFIHTDMIEYLSHYRAEEEPFDILVSNPPYIPCAQIHRLPKDVQCEPRIALDGGEDGLHFYRSIIERAPFILKRGGYLVLELGDGQKVVLEELLANSPGYQEINFYKDYCGIDRVLVAKVTNENQPN